MTRAARCLIMYYGDEIMRLLLCHRFFWPDSAPYGLILRDMALRLAEAGHEVHVQSAVPSYAGRSSAPCRATLDGIQIYRCGSQTERGASGILRALNAARYVSALIVRILLLRPDVVLVSSFPPVVPAWAAALAARMVNARFVYHVQDIHPEASAVIGARLGRGPIADLLRRMDTATLRRSDVVVTLTGDMAQTLRARGAPIRDLRLIENPPLDDSGIPGEPDPALRKRPGSIRAIFAGNMGRFQNLPTLAEGVAQQFSRNPDLELCFLGDGAALPALRATWGQHPRVRFFPSVPIGIARTLLAEADIGLVALQPGMYRVASPSKVQTYAALGLPIVALVDPESQLAAQIVSDGLGCVASPPNADGVAQAIRDVMAKGPRPKVLEPSDTQSDPLSAWPELIASLETPR